MKRAIRSSCEGTNEALIRTRAWAWRPAATAFPPLQLHALPSRHPPTHRSGFARDRPGLGRVVTCHSAAGMLLLKHPQRPAAGSIPAQADARQGLLHGRALLPSQDLEEVRRASCHCILLTWLQLCLARLSPVFSHSMVLFSLHAFPAGVSILPHSPQARSGVWKVEKSKVAFKRSFRFDVRCSLCKGFVRFSGGKCQKNSGPQGRRLKAGAAKAPRGRRGRASRENSSCSRHIGRC